MNRRVICLCLAGAAMASTTHVAADDLLLDKEKIHVLVREVAAKIEEKFKSVHPEADGLVQRVEETLAAQEPSTPNEDDRELKLAQNMILMQSAAAFKSMIGGVRGAVFDDSATGYMQRYQDLESANTDNAEEVWRWLEMASAAQHLAWQDKAEICSQRALGAAHAFVSRQPKNAEAYALLADSLEWSNEKMAALQTALKLDPKQPQALTALIYRRMEQALETAALRRETSLEEPSKEPQELAHALFDRPLSAEETLVFERRQEALRLELVRLQKLAQERGDMTTYLKTVHLLTILKQQLDEVTLASNHKAEESFEQFQIRLGIMRTKGVLTLFADDALLQAALELAASDPEATGSIMLTVLASDAARAQTTQQGPSELHMEIIRKTLGRMVEMATAEDNRRAARAAESAFTIEFGLMMMLGREPTHLDLLLRAVHLDPFRQRTQHMLMGLCMGMFSKDKDIAAATALTLTELALLPSLQTRRTCAAAATKMHDWPAAHHYLDSCLKEKPDDLGLLNQKAVTFLRESQSKAAQKKAEFYFHKIKSLREKPEVKPSKDDLRLIASNYIIFLMLGGKNDAAREELAVVKRDKLLGDKECKELEKLLP